MASRVLPICLLVLVVTIVSALPADEKPFDCPQNEQYYKCDLEVCYKTCEHLKNSPPCPSIAAGCFKPSCQYGYLRNSDGICVPFESCSGANEKPFDCPKNEEYYECGLYVCVKTCDELKNPPPCPPLAPGCIMPSCECVHGYVRNSEGICVPEDKCCK